MQLFVVILIGSFLFGTNEAKPKPDTIEIVQNGANTEVIDFKPNGQEEVIDFNQTPWGNTQTFVSRTRNLNAKCKASSFARCSLIPNILSLLLYYELSTGIFQQGVICSSNFLKT